MNRLSTILAVVIALALVGGAVFLFTVATESPDEVPPAPAADDDRTTRPPNSTGTAGRPAIPPASEPGAGTPRAARERGRTPPSAAAPSERGAVHGVVRFGDGDVCAGVEVRLAGPGQRMTLTDERGHYRLENAAAGPRVLLVRSADFPTVRSTVTLVARSDVSHEIRVPAGLGVRGRVLDEYSSLPVAKATVTFSGKGITPRTVTTGADGRYAVKRVYPPHVHVHIVAETHEKRTARFLVEPEETGWAKQDIHLLPFIFFTGRVEPPQPATLTLVRSGDGGAEALGESKDDGTFRVAVKASRSPFVGFTGTLVAEALGGWRGDSREVLLFPRKVRPPLLISLVPGGTVSGHVFGAEGPCADVRVELTSVDSPWMDPITATTKDDGTFRINRVPRGRWQPSASKGSKRGVAERIQVKSKAHVSGVAIALAEGGMLDGAVVDSAGKPIAGAVVRAAEGVVRTVKDGTYRLSGLPKRVNLTVAKKGYATETRDGLLTDIAVDAVVMKRIHPITGRVTRPDDRPAAGFWIEVYRTAPNGQVALAGRRTVVRADDGTFSFPVTTAGQYYVLAGAGDRSISEMTPVKIDLDIPPVALAVPLLGSARLAGHVRGTNGEPIAGARVTINRKPSGWARSLETTLNGRFVMPSIAVGSYEINVRHDDWFGAKRRAVIGSDSDHRVDVMLGRGGALVVQVLRELNQAVTGARVEIFRGEDKHSLRPRYPLEHEHLEFATSKSARARFQRLDHRLTHTNEYGLFVRPVLQPGTYRIRVRREGFDTVEQDAEIREGQTESLNVTLMRTKRRRPSSRRK